MPATTRDGVSLYYEVDGAGGSSGGAAAGGETVVFVNDVGAGAWLWSWQQPALAGPHETLVWDLRGTGRSDATAGPYAVETLAADLEAVLADCGVAEAHLVGAGLGGMVALGYAHRYARARSLTLLGTAASGEAVTDRLGSLRASPDEPETLRASLDVAFEADLESHADVVDLIVEWRAEDDADLAGWDAQAAAMRRFEGPPLYEVTVPALVLHGVADVVVPDRAGEALAEDLPRGEYRAVEGGHWCFVESAGAVTDAIAGWLDQHGD